MAQADFVERGRQLCARAQYQEAVKVCRLGLLAHPTEVEGRLILGEALLALSRFDEVLAEMRVALELDGENPRALGLKGAALMRKGDILQACDVLARAVTNAPTDPTLRQLYFEARNTREAAFMQSSAGIGGSRGQQPGRPFLAAQADARRQNAAGAAEARMLPSMPDGRKDSTMELDPEVDPVEFVGQLSEVSEPSIELSASDLLPGGYQSGLEALDGPFAARRSALIPPLEAPVDRQLTGPSARLSRPAPSPTAMPSAAPQTQSPAAAAAGPHVLMQGDHPGAETGARLDPRSSGRMEQMAGEEGRGGPAFETLSPGSLQPGRGTDPGDASASTWRSRSEDMRTIRQGLGLPPDGSAAGGPVPRPSPGGPWAAGSPSGIYPATEARPEPRQTRDSFPLQARMPAPRQPQPNGHDPRVRPPWIRGSRSLSRVPLIVYALLGLLVVVGAVLAGFKVRSMRLEGQIASARAQADGAAESDTYTGYLVAIDAYRRIADAAGDLESRAAHAAMAARMAAEVGDGLDQARRLVAELDQETSLPEALAARGFLALADEDAVRATRAAVGLRQVAPEHPDALHLAGRAALLSDKPSDAAQLLRAALEKKPRPAVAVALARAEAGQGRFAEAMAALERAFKLRRQHPGATLWAARIAVWGKSFPARAGEPEASLDALIQEAARPAAEQTLGVSPAQAAWAALALAEVKLARGDRSAAQGALSSALVAQAPYGLSFRSALIGMLVAVGDLAAAREQVELTVKQWPNAVAGRLLEARVAMASGDPASALAALDRVGDLTSHPEGLALRGRARLAGGAIEQAAADLDAALALRADQPEAILARAEVDLARGAARLARRRLQPLYGNGSDAPVEVVAAYAASLRQSGNRAEARRTLVELGRRRPAEAGDWRVLLEHARLARAESAFRAAAALYRNVIAAAPRSPEARLEAAVLSLDLGNLQTAQNQLEAMVKEGTQSGQVLIETARVRILSGNHAGASELLDAAAKLPAPSWKVARERGRLLLRQRRPELAVTELARAKAAAMEDEETRALLMETHLLAKNRRAAARELVDLTKSFRGTPILALGRGMEALARERYRDAAKDLARAHEMARDDGEPPRVLGRAAYWTGRTLYLDDKVSRATEWLNRAIEHDPSLADAHYLLGQIAFEKRSPDRMVKRFEKAVKIDPAGNPSAWFFLGENYISRRRYTQARQALTTYLERWPEGDFSTDARELLSKLP